MSRNVPAALQTHLSQSSTTTTRLLRIQLKNGTVYGITTLDRDVSYNDGAGTVNYVSANGFDSSTFSSDIGYSVDNAEGYALISDDVPGVTVEMAEIGDLDDAEWKCYLVNFQDLTMGHVLLDAGDLGEVRTKYGMIWIPELLSYMMRLRQPVGGVWSRTCRAIFGTPANSQTGCGVDVEPLWVYGTVTGVGAESDREFDGTEIVGTEGILPFPGRVQWLTGDNAGREYATEDVVDTGNVVMLSETTAYAIQIGDTYRIRPDCRKRYHEDCIAIYDNGPNFKGEPLTPVGDGVAIQAPGSQIAGGGGYEGRGPEPLQPDLGPPPVIAFVGVGGFPSLPGYFINTYDAVTWTDGATEDCNWTGVCFATELQLFCAVANTGTNRVMTSPDGIVWTPRSASIANSWQEVAWSASLGLFAAIAGSGDDTRAMTSPDGITWTTRATPALDQAWNTLCWSPDVGLFVAVSHGSTNGVMTSSDGITWTHRNAAGLSSASYQGVCWSPALGLFVAVGAAGVNGRCMTSPDGINWTIRTVPAKQWLGVAWSPELNLFCAVGLPGGVMTSSDGINWTLQTSVDELQYWQSIAWSSSLALFVAIGRFSTVGVEETPVKRMMTSPDGVTWTEAVVPANSDAQWFSVCAR